MASAKQYSIRTDCSDDGWVGVWWEWLAWVAPTPHWPEWQTECTHCCAKDKASMIMCSGTVVCVCVLCLAWLITEFQTAWASSDGPLKDQQDASVSRMWLCFAWSGSLTLQLGNIFSYRLFTAEIRAFILFQLKRWEVELMYYSFSAPVNLNMFPWPNAIHNTLALDLYSASCKACCFL